MAKLEKKLENDDCFYNYDDFGNIIGGTLDENLHQLKNQKQANKLILQEIQNTLEESRVAVKKLVGAPLSQKTIYLVAEEYFDNIKKQIFADLGSEKMVLNEIDQKLGKSIKSLTNIVSSEKQSKLERSNMSLSEPSRENFNSIEYCDKELMPSKESNFDKKRLSKPPVTSKFTKSEKSLGENYHDEKTTLISTIEKQAQLIQILQMKDSKIKQLQELMKKIPGLYQKGSENSDSSPDQQQSEKKFKSERDMALEILSEIQNEEEKIEIISSGMKNSIPGNLGVGLRKKDGKNAIFDKGKPHEMVESSSSSTKRIKLEILPDKSITKNLSEDQNQIIGSSKVGGQDGASSTIYHEEEIRLKIPSSDQTNTLKTSTANEKSESMQQKKTSDNSKSIDEKKSVTTLPNNPNINLVQDSHLKTEPDDNSNCGRKMYGLPSLATENSPISGTTELLKERHSNKDHPHFFSPLFHHQKLTQPHGSPNFLHHLFFPTHCYLRLISCLRAFSMRESFQPPKLLLFLQWGPSELSR